MKIQIIALVCILCACGPSIASRQQQLMNDYQAQIARASAKFDEDLRAQKDRRPDETFNQYVDRKSYEAQNRLDTLECLYVPGLEARSIEHLQYLQRQCQQNAEIKRLRRAVELLQTK